MSINKCLFSEQGAEESDEVGNCTVGVCLRSIGNEVLIDLCCSLEVERYRCVHCHTITPHPTPAHITG